MAKIKTQIYKNLHSMYCIFTYTYWPSSFPNNYYGDFPFYHMWRTARVFLGCILFLVCI